jgi:hypothetical protein
MPNPKGNPDNLQPYKYTTDRLEALTEKITVRVSPSMNARLKALDDYAEFVRQAIAKALDELEKDD